MHGRGEGIWDKINIAEVSQFKHREGVQQHRFRHHAVVVDGLLRTTLLHCSDLWILCPESAPGRLVDYSVKLDVNGAYSNLWTLALGLVITTDRL